MIRDMLNGVLTQEELLRNYNASITYIRFPNYIHGFVFSYKNINNIFVNKNMSIDMIKHTILHELAHIELNQLNQVNNDLFGFFISKYEDEAETYLNGILESLT